MPFSVRLTDSFVGLYRSSGEYADTKKPADKAGFFRFQVFTGTSEIILMVPEAGTEPIKKTPAFTHKIYRGTVMVY